MTGPMIESLEDRAFFSVSSPTDAACTNNLRGSSTQTAAYAPAQPSGVIPSTQTNVVIAIIAVLVG
jgi:hypothetical protein